MMRFIALTFFGCLFLSAVSVFGQTVSDEEELIWTEEEAKAVEEKSEVSDSVIVTEEMFDAEERTQSEGLLRFLKIDPQSGDIEVEDSVNELEPEERVIESPAVTEKAPSDSSNLPAVKGKTAATPVAADTKVKSTHHNDARKMADAHIAHLKQLSTPDYVPFDDRVTFADTVIVNPLFLPFVFDGKVLPDNYQLYDPNLPIIKRPQVAQAEKVFNEQEKDLFCTGNRNKQINRQLRNYIVLAHPELVKYSAIDMPTDIPVAQEIKKPGFLAQLTVGDALPAVSGGPDQYVQKIKHFITTGNSLLQFSQNYLSPNWSTGGISSINLLARNEFHFDYDNRKKLKIENTLFSEQLLTTGQGDTLRSIRISTDKFYFKSLFGIKAAKNWDYTLSGRFDTQFFKNYQVNTNSLYSAFLAPFMVNAGLGMRYSVTKQFKSNKYKKLMFNTNIAPLSLTYKYTRDPNIQLERNGFDPGETSYLEFGSTVEAAMVFDISRYIQWSSKFRIITSYKDVDTFFENALDFKVTRYLSTRIYLDLVYNSKAKKSPDWKPGLQLNELLSFGFNYNW